MLVVSDNHAYHLEVDCFNLFVCLSYCEGSFDVSNASRVCDSLFVAAEPL